VNDLSSSRLLAIETSGEACSVALGIGDELLVRHEHAPLGHAERLLPFVRAVLAEAGFQLAKLDAIVFGQGPGSFTSLRIGIGAVQGLAWGAGLPVVPVSSLQALASQPDSAGISEVQVATDARMGEVFHCRYKIDAAGWPMALEAEQVSPPAHLVRQLESVEHSTLLGVGNGFERYPELEELGQKLHRVDQAVVPSAATLLPLAVNWLRDNKPLAPIAAQPVYVRNQVALKISER